MFDGIRDAARGVVAGRVGHGLPVDYTDDWDRGPWLLLTNGVLSAERQEVIDFTITNRARRFYRTVVQPWQSAFSYGVNVPRSPAWVHLAVTTVGQSSHRPAQGFISASNCWRCSPITRVQMA